MKGRDCLPLKGIMTVFCLIFCSTSEVEREGAKSNTHLLRERKKRGNDGEREREREREKRVIEESIRVARDWDPGCNDRGVFGNSDDVQRDSCFEMSTANSSALQLSWRVFLRFSSPAEFVFT